MRADAIQGARHPQQISTQASPHRHPEARTSASWRRRADVLTRCARMCPASAASGKADCQVRQLRREQRDSESWFFDARTRNPSLSHGATKWRHPSCEAVRCHPSNACTGCNRGHPLSEELAYASHVGRADAGVAADTKALSGRYPALPFPGSRIRPGRTNVTRWKAIALP